MSSRLLQFSAVVALTVAASVMTAGVAQACPGAAMKSTDGAQASTTASTSTTVQARRS